MLAGNYEVTTSRVARGVLSLSIGVAWIIEGAPMNSVEAMDGRRVCSNQGGGN